MMICTALDGVGLQAEYWVRRQGFRSRDGGALLCCFWLVAGCRAPWVSYIGYDIMCVPAPLPPVAVLPENALHDRAVGCRVLLVAAALGLGPMVVTHPAVFLGIFVLVSYRIPVRCGGTPGSHEASA